MSTHRLALIGALALLAGGCVSETSSVVPGSTAPGAEACPEVFDACVEQCRPRGVRQFGCWSPVQGVDYDCECLDGSRPLEDG